MNHSVIELSFFQTMIDLFFDVSPFFFVGLILLLSVLVYFLRSELKREKIVTTIASLLLFYYFFLMFQNIVGIPSISEIVRIVNVNESIFNPHVYLIPFGEGVSLSFFLNILLFIPIGFLSSYISPKFREIKSLAILVLSMSLVIEISQLFTLYRATDINDLIANTAGGILGMGFYLFIEKIPWTRNFIPDYSKEKRMINYLPVLLFVLSFVNVFIT